MRIDAVIRHSYSPDHIRKLGEKQNIDLPTNIFNLEKMCIEAYEKRNVTSTVGKKKKSNVTNFIADKKEKRVICNTTILSLPTSIKRKECRGKRTIVRCNHKRVKCDCLATQKKALARAWKKQFIKVHTLKNKEKQQSTQDAREEAKAKFEDQILEESVNEDGASTFLKFEKDDSDERNC